MNFNDAMSKIEEGCKITRAIWRGAQYFLLVGDVVKTYCPSSSYYEYEEDIMVSDGWIIDDCKGSYDLEKKYKFCEIIPHLWLGAKAKLPDWEGCEISLDRQDSMLVLKTMRITTYRPTVIDFLAEDWMVIE